MKNLIRDDKYQVFLMGCRATMPFGFASHSWFVINKMGLVSRWEVRRRQVEHSTKWGHLYKDFSLMFQGVEIMPSSKRYFWKSKLLGFIEEEEGSVAQKMGEFIENSDKNYPNSYKYSLTGPNSNTYVQWVLNKFPEFGTKLSWSFVGKGFKIKE